MRMEREASFEAGLQEGKAVGLQEGEEQAITKLVRKKYENGQSIEKIAEDLLEDKETIEKILKDSQ